MIYVVKENLKRTKGNNESAIKSLSSNKTLRSDIFTAKYYQIFK
jgi:hypothetical protein